VSAIKLTDDNVLHHSLLNRTLDKLPVELKEFHACPQNSAEGSMLHFASTMSFSSIVGKRARRDPNQPTILGSDAWRRIVGRDEGELSGMKVREGCRGNQSQILNRFQAPVEE
jgi:hypothetical protein